VAKEQRDDPSLAGCWKLADKGRAGFVVKDNLLYHRTKILGQDVYQLVVPESRSAHVLKMGHDSFGGHMAFKRTKARISYTFYCPGMREDCLHYVKTCETCQLKTRVTYRDRLGAVGPGAVFVQIICAIIAIFTIFTSFMCELNLWHMTRCVFVNTCAVVYENDNDFGNIDVITLSTKVSSRVRPSHMIDASLHTVSAVLTQTGDEGTELPVAFSSTKLSQAQMAWSTIEREAYCVGCLEEISELDIWHPSYGVFRP